MELSRLIKGLRLSEEKLLEIADWFAAGRGLANLPSYINLDRQPQEGEYLALEIGGTNLRAAKVEIKIRNSKYEVKFTSKIIRGEIPCLREECSIAQFYGQIIDKIAPVLAPKASIGFVFSYPTEITADLDGKLLFWTKEVKVPAMKGKVVGQELKKILNQKGYQDCRTVVLNDTVAVLLAGIDLVEDPLSLIGLVYGTGMNIAIIKDGKIINTEAGNFDFSGLELQTEFDKQVDLITQNPGKNVFEKLITGAYLPLVFNQIMGREVVADTREMTKLQGEDKKLAEALFDRSARLVAAALTGVLRTYPTDPVNIVVEGSLFWKVPGQKALLERYLRELSKDRKQFRLLKVEDSGLIGAGIAAAVAS